MLSTKVNTRSITAKLDKVREASEDKIKSRLKDIAEDIAGRTRVDTGAFAESWSVQVGGSGAGRVKTKSGREGNQDIGRYQGIAYSNMASDIESLPIFEINSATFRNRAAYAPYVSPTGYDGRNFQEFVNIIKDRYR